MIKGSYTKKKYGLLWIITVWIGFLAAFVATSYSAEADQKIPGEKQTGEYVSIDFKDVDIRTFVKFISELTEKNFVIDNKVRGKVNIVSPGKIPVEQAFRVFESVLEVHGFTTVKSGNIYKIIRSPEARTKSIDTLVAPSTDQSEDKVVTQLIPLQYADPKNLKRLFSPLVSKGSVVLDYEPTNTLIVTDIYSNIKRLLKIVKAIDVKDGGSKISVIPLEFADAENLAGKLEVLFRAKQAGKDKGPGDQFTKFVADKRTNALIVLAGDFNTKKTKELVSLLDKQVPKSDARIHVYYLENANAEELATVLQNLSGKTIESEKGKQVAPVVSEKVQITADNATNSLIIMADKNDYHTLETIIKKLDITRPMVYIEALILEVRLTSDFNLGVEWKAGGTAGTSHGSPTGFYSGYNKENTVFPSIDTSGNLQLPDGFSMGILGTGLTLGGVTFPTVGAAVNALKKNEDVHILSTPQIMTTDNEEAKIFVGENVPFLTKSASGEQNYETFEYKDVGVTLKITPQISKERFVRLNIFQDVVKVSGGTDEFKPTTLKRNAETTIVVKDSATVVIGGLIGEDLNKGNTSVPCLGDVPGFGQLFRSRSRSGTKTNLYIFLTPHIVENPAEADEIYMEKKEYIDKIREETINMFNESSTEENAYE